MQITIIIEHRQLEATCKTKKWNVALPYNVGPVIGSSDMRWSQEKLTPSWHLISDLRLKQMSNSLRFILDFVNHRSPYCSANSRRFSRFRSAICPVFWRTWKISGREKFPGRVCLAGSPHDVIRRVRQLNARTWSWPAAAAYGAPQIWPESVLFRQLKVASSRTSLLQNCFSI